MVTNHLLSGMILQVPGGSAVVFGFPKVLKNLESSREGFVRIKGLFHRSLYMVFVYWGEITH